MTELSFDESPTSVKDIPVTDIVAVGVPQVTYMLFPGPLFIIASDIPMPHPDVQDSSFPKESAGLECSMANIVNMRFLKVAPTYLFSFVMVISLSSMAGPRKYV